MSTTYVVELTPVGRGAVAVLLVAGQNGVRAVNKLFLPAGKLTVADAPVGRILFGRWGSGGEELVVCRRAEDRVEVHCHGGVAAVRAVIHGLQAEGCRPIFWRDWVRIESTGQDDAVVREAKIALADAVTARTAAILLDQLKGALSAAIRTVLAALAAEEWSKAAAEINQLLQHRDVGLHLTTPWQVVFAGPPNVGKSSLINALAGYERAIVSPVPGTTRDVLTVTTAIDGWPVVLADTAGLRSTSDELESAGVELTQAALASADLAILVRDATAPAAEAGPLPFVLSRTIHVLNKIDLLPKTAVEHDAARGPSILTSALTNQGIAELATAIARALAPNPPPRGAAIPFTPEQFETLAVARNAIERRHAIAASDALQSMLSVTKGSASTVQD
jgi:tRNA modification GTPase